MTKSKSRKLIEQKLRGVIKSIKIELEHKKMALELYKKQCQYQLEIIKQLCNNDKPNIKRDSTTDNK